MYMVKGALIGQKEFLIFATSVLNLISLCMQNEKKSLSFLCRDTLIRIEKWGLFCCAVFITFRRFSLT